MKKALYLLLLVLIFILTFVGCVNENNLDVDITNVYVYEESTETIKPTITFKENNQYTFIYSALSSYLPRGSYEISDEYVVLKTDDEPGYEYVFKIKGETLVFDSEKSSEMPSFANVPNEAIFK